MTAEDRCGMSVMITSRDMQKTVRFYRDQLGFELKESWPSDDDPKWANLVLNGQSIMAGCLPDADHVDESCQGDADAAEYWKQLATDFGENKPGVGVQIYVQVDDIDAYAVGIKKKGVEFKGKPKTQFYGIRDLGLDDPDGYRIIFHTPVLLESCQSCGMPLTEAKPGQMYCGYCTDDGGELRPYEQIFEGTVTGYFMGMQNMERPDAESAARDHLSKMPAWAGR